MMTFDQLIPPVHIMSHPKSPPRIQLEFMNANKKLIIMMISIAFVSELCFKHYSSPSLPFIIIGIWLFSLPTRCRGLISHRIIDCAITMFAFPIRSNFQLFQQSFVSCSNCCSDLLLFWCFTSLCRFSHSSWSSLLVLSNSLQSIQSSLTWCRGLKFFQKCHPLIFWPLILLITTLALISIRSCFEWNKSTHYHH